ncbi:MULTISPECIES: hypothetical protein [Stenotrophomonas]|jgi:hypothetical protein|uniref:hypothetical protein n=1 Tax=Stenotrophomonas TaxID=40323 RepID=UPI0028ABB721|nr:MULTISPECIES: hypothetical protein [Stenotrophomonas]
MDIKGQILRKIRPRKAEAFLRSEFDGLGGRRQVAAALKALVESRQLERIQRGIYARPAAIARLGRHRLLAGLHPSKRPPLTGVTRWARMRAKQEGVVHTAGYMDAWATAVTSLAGDSVASDETDDLLVALTRHGKLPAREMVKLVMEHHRRLKDV